MWRKSRDRGFLPFPTKTKPSQTSCRDPLKTRSRHLHQRLASLNTYLLSWQLTQLCPLQGIQSSAVLTLSNLSDITRSTVRTAAESNSELESQQRPYISPSRASYAFSVVEILEIIDCIITAPHCIWSKEKRKRCSRWSFSIYVFRRLDNTKHVQVVNKQMHFSFRHNNV